jgi:phosphotransferase system  glucose/maltose/N-acetylglucosamine-specific IIC component
MTWLSWRLQRTETLITAAVLALLAALLIPTGLHMAAVYDHDGLASCLNTRTRACSVAIDVFTRRFESRGALLAWFNLVPGLIGVLFAAPLIIELENGTYRLAWTQSITRRRWLANKLGVAVGGALLAALALTALFTWWRAPLDHLHGRMQTSVFDFEGTVGFAYVLFALGLALAVGVIWRRTAPAVIVGFVGYTAVRIFVQNWLRQRYQTPVSTTWDVAHGSRPNLSSAWVLSEGPSDKLGHLFPNVFSAVQSCSHAFNDHTRAVDPACLAKRGLGYFHAVYQPASRFWLFQGIETALFGGSALALILFAAWWVHRRAS